MDSLIESTKENYKEEAKTYDKERFSDKIGKFYDNLQKKYIVDWMYGEKDILDIGCGTGRFSIELAKKGFNVTALDQSEEMLNEAKAKSKGLNINFVKGDIFKLPFKDKSFDAVTCIWVLRHFKDEQVYQIINEMKRVIKIDGFIIFDAPTWGLKKYLKRNTNPKTIDRDFNLDRLRHNLSHFHLYLMGDKGLKKFPMRFVKLIPLKLLKLIEVNFNHGKEHLLRYKRGI